jgi:hypothetical protein
MHYVFKEEDVIALKVDISELSSGSLLSGRHRERSEYGVY